MTAISLQISGSSLRRTSPRLSVRKTRESRDAPILRELLELHAIARPRVLDCTYGSGLIWGRLPIRRHVLKADINPLLPGLDYVCSWLALASVVPPHSIDVLVWDPIQVTDVGKSSRVYQRYVAPDHAVNGPTAVSDLFPDFLEVAAQIVKTHTGIVLAKMSDQVHSSRYRWQVFELVASATRRGWTPCQPRVLLNPNPAPVPGVRRQYHTRNNVAWWIVLRNGTQCHGPGRQVRHALTCKACGEPFLARRADARTCSGRCRQRLWEGR